MLLPHPPSLALAALLTAPLVSAHGFIASVSVSGKKYPGANPSWHLLGKSPSAVWYSENYGKQNPFYSSQVNTNDVACHTNAVPSSIVIPVDAGDIVEVTWQTPEGPAAPWRVSHEGPILDYMANCNGDCSDAQASELRFFKIAESGMFMSPHKTADGNNATFGLWATDILRHADNTWSVVIPPSISGQYVLRSEPFALMGADHPGQAQMYPQCISLNISRDSASGSGADPCDRGAECRFARDLYSPDDPGLSEGIHREIEHYPIPGPPVWKGAETWVDPNPLPKGLKPLPMPEEGRNEGADYDDKGGDDGGSSEGKGKQKPPYLRQRRERRAMAMG